MDDLLLRDIESDNIIPDSCLTFSEMYDYLSIYINEKYSDLMMEIGINEISELNESGNIIYEGAKLDQLLKAITDTFDDICNSIKNFWKKTEERFGELSDKSLNVKLDKNKISYLDSTKVYGKTHDFFDISTLDYTDRAISYSKSLAKMFKEAKDGNGDLSKIKEEIVNNAIKEISGIDANSVSEMKKLLRDKLTGKQFEVNKSWLENNFKDFNKIVSDEGYSGKIIKKFYDADMKLFNKIAGEVDTIDSDKYTDIVAPWTNCLVNIVNTTHACYAITMDVYRRQYIEYRNIGIKIHKELKK